MSFCFSSIFITVLDIASNRYLREIKNIKSFNNPEKYMIVDSLLIKQTYDRNEGTGDVFRFDLEGVLLSDNSNLNLAVSFSEYVNFNLKRQPLYKSKLTGDYFLKDAPKQYYEGKNRGFYVGIILKIAFYFIIPFLLYHLIKYINTRKKYRL
ncbi:hypothetical protein [uncultured Polaribacter sp.]|uniref:hypothetical protein n=1 Tax=uncultured Polaribacter sp. TaxID=174711 RepID=UPI002633D32D|nr:hypothetical protein [uncultured Polaribacter sp.]